MLVDFCNLSLFDYVEKKLFDNGLQNAAVKSLKPFVPAYLAAADAGKSGNITAKYLEQLSDPNVAVRRGSALALSILPYEFLANRWKDVLLKLCCSCAIEVL